MMKKFVLALMLLMSTVALSFAGTINYYNQTDQTIQMLRDGNPPGIGSNVIPNGFYSETVGYGNYLLQATNGRQTTSGYACTINADNDRCDYTVSVRESYNTTPGLTYAAYKAYPGFSVDSPVVLTTTGPVAGTTNAGVAYTQTLFSGSLPNDDNYMVATYVYPFAVVNEDLKRCTEGFRAALNGKIIKQDSSITVSGRPALASIVEADVNGRTLRFAIIVTFKGNEAFLFSFGTWLDTTNTDMGAMRTFFNSAAIN